MHIAICDDHIADRKQMERLLGRESDRRISTTGVLYIDSFGSQESIIQAPMIYDALFIDMTENNCDSIALGRILRKEGVRPPIVFCNGTVNYRERNDLPENCLFLDKPVLVAELSQIIDQLLIFKDQLEPLLEFRNLEGTFYVKEEEFLYGYPTDVHKVSIFLTEGRHINADMNFGSFVNSMASCNSYIQLRNRTVLNMRHIRDISFFKVTMTDKKELRLFPGEIRSLKQSYKEFLG